MPRIVVRMNPDGSLEPGMRNLATTPARNPLMIVKIKLMRSLHVRSASRCHDGTRLPRICSLLLPEKERKMARGMPSLAALLGLIAIAGYQNRDKIGEFVRGLGTSDPNSPLGGILEGA